MSWQPGRPVATAQDRAEWQAWRQDRKRQQQRERRTRNPRIDYYPDADAARLIYSMTPARDLSSVINGIVAEWASETERVSEYVPPE